MTVDLAKLKADLDAADADLRRAARALEIALKRAEPKKKPGRPGTWRSPLGVKFVLEVGRLQKKHKGWSRADAIEHALKHPEFRKLKSKRRGGEVRYRETLEYMIDASPWTPSPLSRAENQMAVYESAYARFKAAAAKWLEHHDKGRQQ